MKDYYKSDHFLPGKKRDAKMVKSALALLSGKLERLDRVKMKLLGGAFSRRNLEDLHRMLQEPVVASADSGTDGPLMLKHPASLRTWLYDTAGPAYILDIRGRHRFPSYLLVRVLRDYNADKVFITEIVYASPDYPLSDTGLATLRIWGRVYHEFHHLWRTGFLNLPVSLSHCHPAQPLWKWCHANEWSEEAHYIRTALVGLPGVEKAMGRLDQLARKKVRGLFSAFRPAI